MENNSAVTFLFYVFMAFGILGIILTPIVPLAQDLKLSAGQYASQVFFPSTMSLLLILLAYIGFSFLEYDEIKLKFMITVSALGASLISLLAIILAWNRISYAAF